MGTGKYWALLAVLGQAGCLTNSDYANADLGGSSVVANANTVVTGTSIAVIVKIRRASGAPIPGLTVTLSADSCRVQPTSAVTDANATVLVNVSSDTSATCMLAAHLSQGDFAATLPERLRVVFVAPTTVVVDDQPPPVVVPPVVVHVANRVRILQTPSTVAGAALSLSVVTIDDTGAVNPNFRGSLALQSDANDAVLPASHTFDGGDAGAYTFSGLQFFHSGNANVTVACTDCDLAAAQTTVNVSPSAAASLVLSGVPAAVTAGDVVTSTLTAFDAYGNIATSYAGTAQPALDDPNSPAIAPVAFAAGSGIATFSWSMLHTGAHSLGATDAASRFVAPSNPVQVGAATASSVALVLPRTASVTLPFDATLTAYDAYQNVATGFAGTVHWSSTDPSATLPADLTFDPSGDAGTHRFAQAFALATQGNQTLTATIAAPSVLPAASNTVKVFRVEKVFGGTGYNMCALLSDNTTKCWGNNAAGQLGYGDITFRGDTPATSGGNIPALDLGVGRTVVRVATGDYTTCAIMDDGNTKCWGFNADGEQGVGDGAVRGQLPNQMGDNLPVVPLPAQTVDLAGSRGNGYAVLSDGTIGSWGYGYLCYHFGVNYCDNAYSPLIVSPPSGRTAKQVVANYYSTHLLLDNGTVVGWGENWAGQLGTQNTTTAYTPTAAVNLGTGRTAKALAAMFWSRCAILDDNSLKCWGYSGNGELGYGDTAYRGSASNTMGNSLPTVNLGTGRTATALAAGIQSICVLLDNQQVKCWGNGFNGELGYGDATTRGNTAASMGDGLPTVSLGTGRTVLQIAAGARTTCAILDNHLLKCWGRNIEGELGIGDTSDRGETPGSMGDALPYTILW